MKRLVLFIAAAVMVSTVLAGFKYEGEWETDGRPTSIDVGKNGNVYACLDRWDPPNVYYFTPTGSLLGSWSAESYPSIHDNGLAVGPSGNVYTGGCGQYTGISYFTPTGSVLGSWPVNRDMRGGDIAPNGELYVSARLGDNDGLLLRYTSTGSLVGSWKPPYYEEVYGHVSVAPNGSAIYVAAFENRYVYNYTTSGSFVTRWDCGRSVYLYGIDAAPNGDVFVTDVTWQRVLYFTGASLLGSFGGPGSGPGKFNEPYDVAVSPDGKRVYVADHGNSRVQYFCWSDPAVAPTSLGRVKALFR